MPLPVAPGQALDIPADLWNILQEIAVNERARRDGRAGGPGVRDSILPNWQVKVRNSSGSNRSPFDVLTVDTALCQPDAGSVSWLRRPILDGLAPVAGKAVCVLLDGAAPDDIVTAVIGGLAVVNLDVVSTGDLWADLVAGDAAKLRSGSSGPARVLWKQSAGTGVTLAVVLLVPGVGTAGGGGTTITVQNSTGTPSYAGIGTVQIDTTNGLVLTNPSTPVARLALNPAGVTSAGIVTTTSQFFAGIKTLQDGIQIRTAAQVFTGGVLYTGQTVTISYTKPGGATGTLDFHMGILTAST